MVGIIGSNSDKIGWFWLFIICSVIAIIGKKNFKKADFSNLKKGWILGFIFDVRNADGYEI